MYCIVLKYTVVSKETYYIVKRDLLLYSAYIHTYIHTYTRAYIHTYTHTHIHAEIDTHIQTYIHTHMHTYIYRELTVREYDSTLESQ